MDFYGKYKWLSNFHETLIPWKNFIFPTTEHAYQASKCACNKDMETFLDITAGQAQRLGQKIELSKLKQKDVEKQISRLMIYRYWQKKQFNKMFFYHLAKYLFPWIIFKLKVIKGYFY